MKQKFSLIFAFILLLTGILSLPSNNDAFSSSNSSSIQWIYNYGSEGLALTDLKYTKSDSEIVVSGIIENIDPDNTKLKSILILDLYSLTGPSMTGELLDTLRVDTKRILKPHEKFDFEARYTSPEAASNLDRIYATFSSLNCGVMNVNDMGCFGQGVNISKIDPRTNLPIK